MTTLAEILDELSSAYGNAGICSDDPDAIRQILRDLNEGIPLLMKRMDAKDTVVPCIVPVYGGVFFLPPDILQIRQAFLNNQRVTLRDRYYEAAVGHKIDCYGSCFDKPIVDQGDGHPVPYIWPGNIQDMRLGFVAESDADAGKEVQVNYRDRYGVEQQEILTLPASQQVVSTEKAITAITFVRKTVTVKSVRVLALYPTGVKETIVRYLPRVTIPSFRKMKLPDCDSCGELQILGKLRFIKLTSENDPLPIDDTAALKKILQALQAERDRQFELYNDLIVRAMQELNTQLRDGQSPAVVSPMSVRSPFGRRIGANGFRS